MKNFYAFISGLLVVVSLNGQTVFNLNDTSFTFPQELSEAQRQANPYFNDAQRVRPFFLNQTLTTPELRQVGELWLFDFFDDFEYTAVLLNKKEWLPGHTTYLFRLQTEVPTFAHLTVSDSGYLLNLHDPQTHRRFTTRMSVNEQEAFMFELDPSFAQEACGVEGSSLGFLPEGLPQGNTLLSDGCLPTPEPTDPATVNIMVLYTTASQDWGATNDGGIGNTIGNAMNQAQTIADNSNLNLTFNLVYEDWVSYTEVASGTDLSRLRGYDDGYMDDIHILRGQYQADLVALLTNITGDGIGGIANMPNSRYGNPRTGFSVTKVYQANSINTFTHEIGHNLSADHSKAQASGPGPNNFVDWTENTWTAGWRFQGTNDNYYATVMSYLGQSEYPGGHFNNGIDYFSDPTQSFMGAPMGDPIDADNTRTLKTTKHAIARYRDAARYCPADVGNPTALFIQEVNLDGHIHATTFSLFSDFSAIEACLQPGASLPVSVTANNSFIFNRVAIWVDWNDDGEFSAEENVYRATSGGQVFSTSITVPLNVTPGPKRMRIRLYDPSSGGTTNDSPCGFSSFGELEDYTINVEEPDPCATEAGVQNIVISNIATTSATVSWDGLSGVSQYDLRYRETGEVDWIEASPLYFNTHTLTDLAFDTEHEVQVRAVCSGTPGPYSTSVLFTTTGYCSSQGGSNWNITNVTFSDINNSSSAGNPSDSYTDFTNITGTVDRLLSYDLNITTTGGTNVKSYRVWIDFNQNGIFETSEMVLDRQTASATVSESVWIPGDALLGTTRMRVSYRTPSSLQGPCDTFATGEVEDYTLLIEDSDPCLSDAIVQNTQAITITHNSAKINWNALTGVPQYDLRYREIDAPVWTEVSPIYGVNYTLTGLNNDTEYEVQVRGVCEGTPANYSASVLFTTLKYCETLYGVYTNAYITRVRVGDIDQSSGNSGYSDFTAISTDLNQNATYNIIINNGGQDFNRAYAVWIDYNDNGNFDDPGELVWSQTMTNAPEVTGQFTISETSVLDAVRMRVAVQSTANSSYIPSPCFNNGNFSGEAEDYTINILPFVPCETATVPENFGIENITDNQATLTWDAVPGANYDVRYRETGAAEWIELTDLFTNSVILEPLEAETTYEAQVRSVCDESTVSNYTTSLIFETLATTLVYCDAGATNTSPSFEKIANVTFNTINNNSTSTAGYEDFTHISTTVEKGATYLFSSTISNLWVTDQVIVWIDFNQNGDFTDPGEQVLLINNPGGNPLTGSILIDESALNGPTRMRVRLHDSDSAYGPNPTPCGNSTYGQVEDYTIIITPSGYVYDNGSWTPGNPVGESTLDDNIYVMNGTTALSGNLLANNLFISEGATLSTSHTITLDGDIDNDGLLLFSSNALTTGQLDTFTGIMTGSGQVSMERYIPARRAFRFLSTAVTTSGSIRDNWQEGQNNTGTNFPVDNQNSTPGFGTHITGSQTGDGGFDATPSGNPSLFSYNNATQSWIAAPNTDTDGLIAGNAYRLMVRGDRSINVTSNSAVPTNTTLRTTGTLHTGPFAVSGLSTTENNFSFIGNPYPAAVDMQAVLVGATNINSTHYWVWDPTLGGTPTPGVPGGRGAWVTVNVIDNTSNNGSSQANKYLQPGQAAFVQTTLSAAASLNFIEGHKAVDQPQTQVFNVLSSIKMQLYDAGSFAEGNTASDGLMLRFSEEGNNAVTFEDAMKFNNLDENLASVNNETLLSIESRALPQEGETIPLFTNQYRKTNYLFEVSLSEMNEILVFLKDQYTGALTELFNNETTLYAFQVDPTNTESMADDRFEIVFEEMLTTNGVSFGDGFVLYPNPTTNTFYIATRQIEGDEVELNVSNIRGQKVFSGPVKVPSNGQLQVELPGLSAGIYLVELIHPVGGTFTAKLIKN